MQQRQLRLGDILDDYCPRERRLTNHVVVAMIGAEVKQTRCATCEAEHEYKQAKLPRLRRKADATAVLASSGAAPKRHEPAVPAPGRASVDDEIAASPIPDQTAATQAAGSFAKPDAKASEAVSAPDAVAADDDVERHDAERDDEDGPVHRPLIRASLPRVEGAPPPTRPATDFTIRQPTGRQNRFRPRHMGGQQPPGNRSGGHMGGGGPLRGGVPRHGGGPPAANRMANRHGQGRKRSK